MRVLACTITLAALTAGTIGGSAADPVQWAVNGHSYEALSAPSGITWTAANDSCRTRGGYLATLASAEEHAFVYGLISDRPELWLWDPVFGNGNGPWIGGFQPPGSPEPAGGWRWLSDEPWSYSAWATGEPNNYQETEDRICFFGRGTPVSDRWADANDGSLLAGYVLEISGGTQDCTTWSGHSYRLFRTPQRTSWQNAQAAAAAVGGYLACVTSAAENDVVFGLIGSDPSLWELNEFGDGCGPWIGGYQAPASPEPDGGWAWMSGEPFAYTDWAAGEPNNFGGAEDRLHYMGKGGKLMDRTWNDAIGTSAVGGLGYVVEYDNLSGCSGVDVEDGAARRAVRLSLSPNPTRGRTTFFIDLPVPSRVSLELLDAGGRLLMKLEEGRQLGAGPHAITWNGQSPAGAGVRSGLYLVRLAAGAQVEVGKLIVVR